MTLTKKLGLALVFGAAMGSLTHWFVGGIAFAVAACIVTFGQLRKEVTALRSLVDEEEAAMSIPPESLPSRETEAAHHAHA